MDHPLRIIGGHNAPPFTYSFQVALIINDAHFLCGGTLISSHAVLTAAHCFNDDPFLLFPYSIGVYRHLVYSTDLGEHECARTIPVSKVIRHPLFKAQTYQNDVAVLMLEDDVPCEVTALPVIRLDETGDWWAGARASILGWGVTSSTSNAFSNVLQVAEVTVHAQATCEERLALRHGASPVLRLAGRACILASRRTRRGSSSRQGSFLRRRVRRRRRRHRRQCNPCRDIRHRHRCRRFRHCLRQG
mmetsp:Transcript_34994/g.77008  ORF Transcript_34994/g.77008 Transcript_34994/m.77008 type:complete len:246 (-) Transcript_34994:1406-2143(-)